MMDLHILLLASLAVSLALQLAWQLALLEMLVSGTHEYLCMK